MYYDLNVPWPARAPAAALGAGNPSKKQKGKQRETASNAAEGSSGIRRGADALTEADRLELERCTKMAIKLGYNSIAYNLILPPGTFDIHTVSDLNPCHGAGPVFPELDTRTADVKDGKKTLLQLSRLTVVLDESSLSGGKGNGSIFNSSNANSIAGYNLISALPLDHAAFSRVCLDLTAPGPSSIDIITLDLASSPRLPFQLKRSMVLKAVAEGAVFEICYGVAMRSSSSNTAQGVDKPLSKDARRNVIAGARELIRVTNGKGVIMSSEVRRCMEMRGPLDLCNFGTILGLKPDQAKNTVSSTPRLAVIRGHAHRQTYRGVLGNPEVIVTSKVPQQADEAVTVGEKRKRGSE